MANAKILVVDDDTAMREMMALALSKEGFAVRSADSSDAAMKAVAADSFDLVMSTLVFSELSRDERLYALRHAHRVLRPGGCLAIADEVIE